MRRGLLLCFAMLTLSLVGHSPAAPAPTPKPKPKGAEALLYIKRVPGRTDKEQEEIRRRIRLWLIDAVDQWITQPGTEIPGLKRVSGTAMAGQVLKWRQDNVSFTWVEDTGMIRITCLAGTPREQAGFVNNAVKQGIAFYEEQKESRKRNLRMKEKVVADALKRIPRMQQQLADLSEIVILDLAEVPPK
jgi:hypothetical protein